MGERRASLISLACRNREGQERWVVSIDWGSYCVLEQVSDSTNWQRPIFVIRIVSKLSRFTANRCLCSPCIRRNSRRTPALLYGRPSDMQSSSVSATGMKGAWGRGDGHGARGEGAYRGNLHGP